MAIRMTDTQRRILQHTYNRVLAQTGNVQEAVDITGMVWQESKAKPTAVGPDTGKGRGRAKGLLQFIDSTAKQYGITNPFDIDQSIDATIRFRNDNRKLLAKRGVPPTRANLIAAHNAGPGNVIKHKGVPPFKETQNYVRQITARSFDLISSARVQIDPRNSIIPGGELSTTAGRTESVPSGRPITTTPNAQARSTSFDQQTNQAQTQAAQVSDFFTAASPEQRAILELPTLDLAQILSQDRERVATVPRTQAQQPTIPQTTMLEAAEVQPGVFETFSEQLALQTDILQQPDVIPVEQARQRARRLITGRLING